VCPHYSPIAREVVAVAAVEAVLNVENRLGTRPIFGQWHPLEVVIEPELLSILVDLLPNLDLDLVLPIQVATECGGLDRALAAVAQAE